MAPLCSLLSTPLWRLLSSRPATMLLSGLSQPSPETMAFVISWLIAQDCSRLVAWKSDYCPSLSLLPTRPITEFIKIMPSFWQARVIRQHPFMVRLLCHCLASSYRHFPNITLGYSASRALSSRGVDWPIALSVYNFPLLMAFHLLNLFDYAHGRLHFDLLPFHISTNSPLSNQDLLQCGLPISQFARSWHKITLSDYSPQMYFKDIAYKELTPHVSTIPLRS